MYKTSSNILPLRMYLSFACKCVDVLSSIESETKALKLLLLTRLEDI